MKTYRLKAMVFAVALYTLSALGGTADATVISVQPPLSATSVGSQFDVSVNISDVTDLYAFQWDLGFNPSRLSAVNVTEGPFLSGGGDATFFIPGIIDNAGGTISFVADTLLTAVSGQSGSGPLATITFAALSPGVSPLDLSNVILLDSGLNDITASAVGGEATVSGAAPVPEPSTLALFLVGGAGVALLSRRRSAA